VYELEDGEIMVRDIGRPPKLPGILAMAKEIGARSRGLVESAGLLYIQEPYIADTVRQLRIDKERRIQPL
jgi:hypothetical protein